ncbi:MULTISPECIES: AI-2E family transporter [unclassified Sphingomonas]|uniref:AI-2E family transporter n=1 Tax=unclassified Sphingomonas TaxID=196159 RepID=UPI001F5AD15B|nr:MULTISPECIES: AI-2E family transporter [unclassified Sphingomonas]
MADHSAPPMVSEPSPGEMRDPATRRELKKAAVWLGLIAAMAMTVLLVQPLLVIFAGLVFAAMLDGGVRLLGRVLPIGRGWRLLIVVLAVIAFLLGTFYLMGVQLSEQVTQLQQTLQTQWSRLAAWLSSKGIMPGASDVNGMLHQAMGSVGKLTSFVGTALGALTTTVFILVLGLFFAMEPRIYERGLQWMVPTDSRAEFTKTTERMGTTLRRLLAGRLLGMTVEGVATGIALEIGGVPMALVLGIIAAILAFIPNIGAFITGALMVAVGFSGGMHTGLWALGTWAFVQSIDGYVVVPIVARRTVDLPPALTLSMQILASALFGLLGLMLADPMTAMIKVALERSSEREAERMDADPAA